MNDLCKNCIHLFTGDGKCNDCLQPTPIGGFDLSNFEEKEGIEVQVSTSVGCRFLPLSGRSLQMTAADARMLAARCENYVQCRFHPKRRSDKDWHTDYDPNFLTMDLDWIAKGLKELAARKDADKMM